MESIIVAAITGGLALIGTLAGTFLWWLSLSFAASRFREKAASHQTALSRIFGWLLFIFGMVIWIRLLPGEVQIPLTCMTTAVLRRLVKQGIRCRGTMSGLQRNQEM